MIDITPELEYNEDWLKLVDFVEARILPLIYEKSQHIYGQGLSTGFEAGWNAYENMIASENVVEESEYFDE
jgi:hypothetical protein